MTAVMQGAGLLAGLALAAAWLYVAVVCAIDAVAPEPPRQPQDFRRVYAVDRCLAARGRPRSRYQEMTPAWST